VPVLGICYGQQWMCRELGGEVEPATSREFGRTSIEILKSESLFEGIDGRTVVWMSHGDQVAKLPAGFAVYASSGRVPDRRRRRSLARFFCVQFHPESATRCAAWRSSPTS
jgi:GMP synthase (glutamine-hydrolysing)